MPPNSSSTVPVSWSRIVTGEAIARALRRVLTEPGLAEAMSARAGQVAPTFAWRSVATGYRELAVALIENQNW